ncbi:hypothetical protein [uncultured Tyzzerella sp.]|uniref:hypothetical protein n=1 Tax=uncultured Tyzzerella sp. TaxID=2321398 RepID=UPI002942C3EE|nr:hypothetical protein [uncultured Tyzzerella sp.]
MKTKFIFNDVEHKVNLPISDSELLNLCGEFKPSFLNEENCKVLEVENKELNKVIANKNCNLYELNILSSLIENFTIVEKEKFDAYISSVTFESVGKAINISLNLDGFDLITDFKEIQKMGEKILYNKEEKISDEEFKILKDKYLMTSRGVLTRNDIELKSFYKKDKNKMFNEKQCKVILSIENKDIPNLYLPCSQLEVECLNRELKNDYNEMYTVNLENRNLNEKIYKFLNNYANVFSINDINETTKTVIPLSSETTNHLGNVINCLKIRNLDEIEIVKNNLNEFEYIENISSIRDYGIYMLKKEENIKLTEDLEQFINIEGYGKMKKDNYSIITEKGYLKYYGCNKELEDILNRVGINIENKELKETKIYFPIEVVDSENYDLANYEIEEYFDEILEHLENNISKLNLDEKRGLMKGYCYYDTINAKVLGYSINLEVINGEVMGGANVKLNEELTEKEVEKLKDEIEGEMSDGFGEMFEQRELKTDDGNKFYVRLWNENYWVAKTEEEFIFGEKRYSIR